MSDTPADRRDAARFLDSLRAAEAASAEVLEAWIAVCTLDGLRGGLRAIAEREAGHAELIEERLRELGEPCTAVLQEPVLAAALARFGSSSITDEEKLTLFLSRYPDDAAATRPFTSMIERLESDTATRELLHLVADGELATLGWLRAYHVSLAQPVDRRA
jgi:hypothetical protein